MGAFLKGGEALEELTQLRKMQNNNNINDNKTNNNNNNNNNNNEVASPESLTELS